MSVVPQLPESPETPIDPVIPVDPEKPLLRTSCPLSKDLDRGLVKKGAWEFESDLIDHDTLLEYPLPQP